MDKPCNITTMDCNNVPVLISSSGSPPSGEHDIIRPTPRRPKESGMSSPEEEDVNKQPTNFGSVEKVVKVLQRKLSNTSSVHSGGHSLTKKTVVKQQKSPVELVPERDSNGTARDNLTKEFENTNR